MLEQLAGQLGLTTFSVALLGSILASLGTSLGALPVLCVRSVSQRAQDIMMSASAGIMLAATAFSLVLPGLDAAKAQLASPTWAAIYLAGSIALGALVIHLIHRHAPHEHLIKGKDSPAPSERLARVWLFVIAITLHNFPEGMAVGVGFGGEPGNGTALTLGILIQNIPEGLVVALALAAEGYARKRAVLIACATGFVEIVGGAVGAFAAANAAIALPAAMGIAAGAMLFVISHEIIPETHRNGFENDATYGLIAGFALILVFNAWIESGFVGAH